jgi:hypothetical protein
MPISKLTAIILLGFLLLEIFKTSYRTSSRMSTLALSIVVALYTRFVLLICCLAYEINMLE